MSEKRFPYVPELLLRKLQELYPNQSPSLKDSEREVWYKAGQASVVKLLEEHFKEQTTAEVRIGV